MSETNSDERQRNYRPGRPVSVFAKKGRENCTPTCFRKQILGISSGSFPQLCFNFRGLRADVSVTIFKGQRFREVVIHHQKKTRGDKRLTYPLLGGFRERKNDGEKISTVFWHRYEDSTTVFTFSAGVVPPYHTCDKLTHPLRRLFWLNFSTTGIAKNKKPTRLVCP